MSDEVQLALIAAFTAAISSVCSVSVSYFTFLKLRESTSLARSAAFKVAEVKETLAARSSETYEALGNLGKVAEATHTLVNNNMAIQLRITRDLARRLSRKPGATQADKASFREASEKLAQHERKQADVDAQKGTDAEKSGKPKQEG